MTSKSPTSIARRDIQDALQGINMELAKAVAESIRLADEKTALEMALYQLNRGMGFYELNREKTELVNNDTETEKVESIARKFAPAG